MHSDTIYVANKICKKLENQTKINSNIKFKIHYFFVAENFTKIILTIRQKVCQSIMHFKTNRLVELTTEQRNINTYHQTRMRKYRKNQSINKLLLEINARH